MSEPPKNRRARRRSLSERRGFRNQGHGAAPSIVPDLPVGRPTAGERFLRFTVAAADGLSGFPQGLFQAAYELRDEEELLPHEVAWFADLVAWFDRHLAAPRAWVGRRAVFWFKERAVEHVQRMHALAVLLREHGVPGRILRTRKPGRIVYEDEHQVAAVPYRDSPR